MQIYIFKSETRRVCTPSFLIRAGAPTICSCTIAAALAKILYLVEQCGHRNRQGLSFLMPVGPWCSCSGWHLAKEKGSFLSRVVAALTLLNPS